MLGDGVVMIAWRWPWWLARSGGANGGIAVAAFVTILAARLFVPLMKAWLQRPRPLELAGLPRSLQLSLRPYDFRHRDARRACGAGKPGLRSWGKAVVFAAAGIAVIAIAYSRIYLGAHWMTDVLGGFPVRLGDDRRLRHRHRSRAAAAHPALAAWRSRRFLAFALAGHVHISRDYPANVEIYTPREAIVLYDVEQWADRALGKPAARRVDLAGRSEEPFSVQWAGDRRRSLKSSASRAGRNRKWSWTLGLPISIRTRGLADLRRGRRLHRAGWPS